MQTVPFRISPCIDFSRYFKSLIIHGLPPKTETSMLMYILNYCGVIFCFLLLLYLLEKWYTHFETVQSRKGTGRNNCLTPAQHSEVSVGLGARRPMATQRAEERRALELAHRWEVSPWESQSVIQRQGLSMQLGLPTLPWAGLAVLLFPGTRN